MGILNGRTVVVVEDVTFKYCPCCEVFKRLEFFNKDSSKTIPFHSCCRECERKTKFEKAKQSEIKFDKKAKRSKQKEIKKEVDSEPQVKKVDVCQNDMMPMNVFVTII